MLVSDIKAEMARVPFIELPDEMKHLMETQTDLPYVNGCGAGAGVFAGAGPTEIDGVRIVGACLPHDFRYTFGETMEDKVKADLQFLTDLNQIIINDPGNLAISVERRQLRFNEAMMLFKFVHVYGLKAYEEGKLNIPDKSIFAQVADSAEIGIRTFMIPFEIIGSGLKAKLRVNR